jgi:uncharacterized protein (DUF58 family)
MAVMFVGSLFGRSNMLMVLFAMMAGPWILNGWITFSMLKRTRVARSAPRRAMAGELVSVRVELSNRKRWLSAWLMTARDQIANQRERLNARVLFARVPPRDRRAGYYQMRLMQRGRYSFGPMELSTRFPLGLVERGLLFETCDEILVHPRIGQLSPRWKRDHLFADELAQQRSSRPGTFDDEFHTLREYRWGDNPRAIHWRTSARRSEVMVREFHQSRDSRLAVFLDLWLPKTPAAADLDRVELAVSFCATVCVDHFRGSRDSSLYLAASGKEFVRWEGHSGGGSLDSLLDMLAVLDAGFSQQSTSLIDDLDAQRAPNIQTILITTRKRVEGHFDGFPDFQSNGYAGELWNSIHVVETNPLELSSFFAVT